MKKLLPLILVFIISLFAIGFTQAAETTTNCDFDPQDPLTRISDALDDCFENRSDTKLVTTGDVNGLEKLSIEDGFKKKINSWVEILGSILAILAVGSIVYGSLLLVLSQGEEEKLKKGKDVVKWGILGFLAVIFAGVLIRVVVNIMFSI